MENDSAPTGGTADGSTTMTEVIAGYVDAGFGSNFDVTDDGQLLCGVCGTVSAPAEVPMGSLRRLEGESDPADMVAVVALTCPACDARGTVVLGFGPMASAQDADVLHGLRDEREGGELPGNSAPGEAIGDRSSTDDPG